MDFTVGSFTLLDVLCGKQGERGQALAHCAQHHRCQHIPINWDEMGLSNARDVFIYLFLRSESLEWKMSKLRRAQSFVPSVTEQRMKTESAERAVWQRGMQPPVTFQPSFGGHGHEFSQ